MEQKFNPIECYTYLVNAGVCAANVDHFVAGLKRHVANDPPIVFTPCPIVYFEPSSRQFFVLPFLCPDVSRNKIWGICLSSLFVRIGDNGPMTIEKLEMLLQEEQNVAFGTNCNRQIKLPTRKELERILAYDIFNSHWKTVEIMKSNGFICDTSCFSYLNAYAIFDDSKQKTSVYASYSLDEVLFEKTVVRALKPEEKVYALCVLEADFSVDKVGKVDEYGFPDTETLEILSVLKTKN